MKSKHIVNHDEIRNSNDFLQSNEDQSLLIKRLDEAFNKLKNNNDHNSKKDLGFKYLYSNDDLEDDFENGFGRPIYDDHEIKLIRNNEIADDFNDNFVLNKRKSHVKPMKSKPILKHEEIRTPNDFLQGNEDEDRSLLVNKFEEVFNRLKNINDQDIGYGDSNDELEDNFDNGMGDSFDELDDYPTAYYDEYYDDYNDNLYDDYGMDYFYDTGLGGKYDDKTGFFEDDLEYDANKTHRIVKRDSQEWKSCKLKLFYRSNLKGHYKGLSNTQSANTPAKITYGKIHSLQVIGDNCCWMLYG